MTIPEQPIDPVETENDGEYQDEANRERIDHLEFMRDIAYDRETGIPRFGEI